MRPPASRSAFDGPFELDDAQAAAVEVLTSHSHRGVYMWGPVGRGKTWLLDRYYAGAASTAKKRTHFHTFFRELHASYFRHRFSMERTLDEVLGDIELLCFDEFHVHDIGDAMLIARLLDALIARKVALVVTSNYPPDGLLPNPLFHDRFTPTIRVLEGRMDVLRVDGPVDYRRTNNRHGDFARGAWHVDSASEGMSFAELCSTPRSATDYIAMLENAECLTISEIPPLRDVDAQSVQRFSNLVDILYDRGIRSVFHARVDLASFGAGCAGLDIDRTLSRLSELQVKGPK